MVGILDIISPILGEVIDRVIPDPKAKAEMQLKLAELADKDLQRQHDEMMGQISTNTEEAKNSNLFVSGWRPAVGWIGAIGLGYSFVVEPFTDWIARVIFHYGGAFPVLDTGQLMALVTGMLGFGGMRALEKINKVPDSQPMGGSKATPVTTAAPAQPQPQMLSPSVKSRDLICQYEGCRLTAYKDSGGVLTIGYGHTGKDVKSGMKITQDMALVLLAQDMAKAASAVLRHANKVTQGQLDALTSFVFNLGEGQFADSTLLKLHNQGRYDLAAQQFSRWVHDNGKVLPGLVKRREAEKELYLS